MIRRATLNDLQTVVDGNVAMALETESLTLDRGVVERGVRRVLEGVDDAHYRVFEVDGAHAGQLMITLEWSDWRNAWVWWIQSVYVWPAYRGRGIYRQLYASVLKEAEADGAAGVRLYVDLRNTGARAVYDKLGMTGGHYELLEAMFD